MISSNPLGLGHDGPGTTNDYLGNRRTSARARSCSQVSSLSAAVACGSQISPSSAPASGYMCKPLGCESVAALSQKRP